MGTMAQESGERKGYRRYSAEFKREQVERVVRGELTIAELSRELGISKAATFDELGRHLQVAI